MSEAERGLTERENRAIRTLTEPSSHLKILNTCPD